MSLPQTRGRSPREMRRHCRVEGNWRLVYEVGGHTHTTSVANLSRGGMFVRSGRDLKVGETYTFRLFLTDNQTPLKIRGVVLARMKGNRGGSHHARVQFVPGQGAAMTRLREFMLETVLPSLEAELRKTMRAPAKAASLAELRAELGDWPAAIALYRRSLALNPKSQALHERAVVFYLTALESGAMDPRPALVEAENALSAGQRLGASAILDAAAEELAAADRQVAEHDQQQQEVVEQAQRTATEAEQRDQAIAFEEEHVLREQNRGMLAAQRTAPADSRERRSPGFWPVAGFATAALAMVAGVLYVASSPGSAPNESAVATGPPGRAGTQLAPDAGDRTGAQLAPDAGDRTGAQLAPGAGDRTGALLAEPVRDGREAPEERVDADTPVHETLEHTVAPGETLSSIAREQYGAFELWPVILSSNLSKLDDPDRLEIGTRLFVPTLEGSAADLSDHDRELVAASYETVSRYYQSRSTRRAAFYWRRAARYRAGQNAVLEVSPGP